MTLHQLSTLNSPSTLSTIHYSLSTFHSLFFTFRSPLSSLHSLLFTPHSPLSIPHSTAQSPLSALHSPLSMLHSPFPPLHSSLSISPCQAIITSGKASYRNFLGWAGPLAGRLGIEEGGQASHSVLITFKNTNENLNFQKIFKY